MTIKSHIIGFLSLGFLTVGGAAIAAPSHNQGRAPAHSEARGHGPEQRHTPNQGSVSSYRPTPITSIRTPEPLSPREAKKLKEAERQISLGKATVERGREMVRRGERTRDRQLIRKGERLMEQGREQLSKGTLIKMRILA